MPRKQRQQARCEQARQAECRQRKAAEPELAAKIRRAEAPSRFAEQSLGGTHRDEQTLAPAPSRATRDYAAARSSLRSASAARCARARRWSVKRVFRLRS